MTKLNRYVLLILVASTSMLYADNNPSIAQMQQQLQSLQASRDQLQATISQQLDQLSKINTNISNVQNNIKQAQILANSAGINWVPSPAQGLPDNAFVAAQNNGQNIYICQASYNPNTYQGGTYPGILQNNTCVITYGGTAYNQQNYTILTSTKTLYWIDGSAVPNLFSSPINPGTPPWVNFTVMPATKSYAQQQQQQPATQPAPPAVVGGNESSRSVYICRANIGNTWFVGKLISGNVCMIAVDGKEASWPDYQVLMTKQINAN